MNRENVNKGNFFKSALSSKKNVVFIHSPCGGLGDDFLCHSLNFSLEDKHCGIINCLGFSPSSLLNSDKSFLFVKEFDFNKTDVLEKSAEFLINTDFDVCFIILPYGLFDNSKLPDIPFFINNLPDFNFISVFLMNTYRDSVFYLLKYLKLKTDEPVFACLSGYSSISADPFDFDEFDNFYNFISGNFIGLSGSKFVKPDLRNGGYFELDVLPIEARKHISNGISGDLDGLYLPTDVAHFCEINNKNLHHYGLKRLFDYYAFLKKSSPFPFYNLKRYFNKFNSETGFGK